MPMWSVILSNYYFWSKFFLFFVNVLRTKEGVRFCVIIIMIDLKLSLLHVERI
jgi:hypothetical protein